MEEKVGLRGKAVTVNPQQLSFLFKVPGNDCTQNSEHWYYHQELGHCGKAKAMKLMFTSSS